MGFNYQSKFPDENGLIQYTETENDTWSRLIARQNEVIQGRACDEYIEGLNKLNLPSDRVPQVRDINKVLNDETGWAAEVVPAVIPAEEFFNLLKNKKFPTATFIRVPEEFDYLEEPDVFHEVYGHCPLLTHPAYANYMQEYGKLALDAPSKKIRNRLFRLFWFTIEFGLLKKTDGYSIYGGGILSSYKETLHCLDNPEVIKKPLNILEAMRTPFRIDIIQPLYYHIDKIDDLFKILEFDLYKLAEESIEKGNLEALFKSKDEQPGDGYNGDDDDDFRAC